MTVVHGVEHALEYRYEVPVRGSVMTLYLRPRESRRQTLEHFSLETDPPGAVREFTDGFGNRGHFFTRHLPHGSLRISARSRVRVTGTGPLPAAGSGSPDVPGVTAGVPELQLMLQPSRFVRPGSATLANFLSTHGIERENDLLRSLRTLASRLFEIFEYAPGATAADSPIDRILETGRGVCQDYTHIMASIARRWGIPARYVSGYLSPDGDGGTGPGESHAWVECWLPEPGWVGFDPANDCVCDDRHVRVAVGRDYADVPPSRGIFQGCSVSTLVTRVAITRDESGRRSEAPFDFLDNSNQRSAKPCDSITSSSTPAASSGSRLPWV